MRCAWTLESPPRDVRHRKGVTAYAFSPSRTRSMIRRSCGGVSGHAHGVGCTSTGPQRPHTNAHGTCMRFGRVRVPTPTRPKHALRLVLMTVLLLAKASGSGRVSFSVGMGGTMREIGYVSNRWQWPNHSRGQHKHQPEHHHQQYQQYHQPTAAPVSKVSTTTHRRYHHHQGRG